MTRMRCDIVDVESPLPARYEIGRHLIVVEQDDLVRLAFRGRMTGPEAVRLKQVVYDLGERLGELDFLVDIGELESFDAGGRAQFARPERPYPFRDVMIFGGSFASRMLIATIVRAGRLIVPQYFGFSTEFVSTEQEARARLTAIRAGKRNAP